MLDDPRERILSGGTATLYGPEAGPRASGTRSLGRVAKLFAGHGLRVAIVAALAVAALTTTRSASDGGGEQTKPYAQVERTAPSRYVPPQWKADGGAPDRRGERALTPAQSVALHAHAQLAASDEQAAALAGRKNVCWFVQMYKTDNSTGTEPVDAYAGAAVEDCAWIPALDAIADDNAGGEWGKAMIARPEGGGAPAVVAHIHVVSREQAVAIADEWNAAKVEATAGTALAY